MPGLRKITANSASWLIGQILNKALGLVLVIYAARLMGEDQFGRYTVVMTYYVIFNVLIDFGLRPLTIREVARSDGRANSYLWAASVIKLLINLLGLGLIVPLLMLVGSPRETFISSILAVVALIPFSLSQTISSMYMALERMYYEAIIVTIGQLLWVVVMVGMLWAGYQLVPIFWALIGVNLVTVLINLVIFSRRFFLPHLELDWVLIRRMFKESLPFAMTSAFAILYFRIDTIMLDIMKGDVDVGWYGAAYRVTDAVNFVPIAMMVSVYPIVSRLFLTNRKAMQIVVEKCYYYLYVLGLPMAAGLSLSADKLITLFFAGKYRPSVVALSILSWSLLPLFLNAILITTMNSANRQNRVTRATLISLVVNIVGNALVIPLFGIFGACLTTILSEYVILTILKKEIRAELGFAFTSAGQLISPILATLVMCVVYLELSSLNLFLLVLISCLVYGVILILTRGVVRSDWGVFKKALLEHEVP